MSSDPKVGDVLDLSPFGSLPKDSVVGKVVAVDSETKTATLETYVPTVYLLHFDEPYPRGHRPQHYLGIAKDLDTRLAEHRSGSSKSRLTRALKALGIGFVVARTWEGGFKLEKELKRRHRPASLCPICNPKFGTSELQQQP